MEAVAHGSLKIASLFSVAGKTAVVTGGGRGIGEMIARTLVENGAKVYIASRSAETCARTAARLSSLGPGSCVGLGADVGTDAGCRALVAEVAKTASRVHILVNNSGISWGAPLDEFPEAQWERVMKLNVASPFLMTRALKPLLEAAYVPGWHGEAAKQPAPTGAAAAGEAAHGHGHAHAHGHAAHAQHAGEFVTEADPARVINIGSIVGLHPQPVPTYSYDASKAAVHALTVKLAGELAPKMTVNAIAPGYVPSRMSRGLLHYASGEALQKGIPMGRFGSAADMGAAVLYLSSRAGAWVTGTVIPVDGGHLAKPLALLGGDEE